jgi:hypothetical protein
VVEYFLQIVCDKSLFPQLATCKAEGSQEMSFLRLTLSGSVSHLSQVFAAQEGQVGK